VTLVLDCEGVAKAVLRDRELTTWLAAARAANSADHFDHAEHRRSLSVEELARRQGVSTVTTVEDLACDDIFDTDEELNEFLTFVREQRNASLA